MLLMTEKGIKGEYVKLFIDMQQLIRNKWKIMIKIKNHLTLTIWCIDNLHWWEMSQKLPLGNF